MINMTEVIANVTLSKVCSIRADKDSTEKKMINLRVKFDGTTIQSVFDKALSGAVIAWQNGVGRNNFDTYKPGQVVEIQFSAPASKPTETPENAFTREAIAAGVNINDDDELSAYIVKRMKAAKA